jgi:hypothetical protein
VLNPAAAAAAAAAAGIRVMSCNTKQLRVATARQSTVRWFESWLHSKGGVYLVACRVVQCCVMGLCGVGRYGLGMFFVASRLSQVQSAAAPAVGTCVQPATPNSCGFVVITAQQSALHSFTSCLAQGGLVPLPVRLSLLWVWCEEGL